MIGVDISDAQPNFPASWYRQWGFVFAKATEGTTFTANTFDQKFAAALSCAHRGAYHYARPGHSGGTAQADYFADVCMAHGFRPGVDLWFLDAETGLNDGVTPGAWRQFITDFMSRATQRLGSLALLYAGYYFWLSQLSGDHSILAPYHWFLPWYGPNDGQLHHPDVQLPQQPFMQQFTSAGNLDRDAVDDASFSTWLQPQKPPPPVTYPVFDVREEDVKTALVSFTTGPDGKGWTIFDPELGHVPAIVGAVINGNVVSKEGHYAFDSDLPIVGCAIDNQSVLVQVEHAVPSAAIGVWVSVA